MIVGRGDIASVLVDREDWYFFASGVSNSQETRESEYNRELELLLKQDKSKHLVYFSSLCIFYSDSRYALHKRFMEAAIKIIFKKYTIIRLGNITWGDNPHTLINFFINKIRKNEMCEIHDVYRYVVEEDEFLHWMDKIPEWNCEMNITGTPMKVLEIVFKYCLGDWYAKVINDNSISELPVCGSNGGRYIQ